MEYSAEEKRGNCGGGRDELMTDAGWSITVVRRDGEGGVYEMVVVFLASSMTALKAGRDVTVFPTKFLNLDD